MSDAKPFRDGVPTLYQAEWCPFSAAVREVLTELGIDFVARQVEPWPGERSELRALAGTELIPVLRTEDGRLFRGTREIFAHLHERDPWRFAAAHRRRFADHRDARESDATGQLIEYFRGTDELEAASGSVEDAKVVDVPEASRYELRLGGRLIGLAAYLAAWRAVEPEERLRAALRVAVPVGIFAYALQVRRLLDFMPAEARPAYEAYMPEQLQALLARLERAARRS